MSEPRTADDAAAAAITTDKIARMAKAMVELHEATVSRLDGVWPVVATRLERALKVSPAWTGMFISRSKESRVVLSMTPEAAWLLAELVEEANNDR